MARLTTSTMLRLTMSLTTRNVHHRMVTTAAWVPSLLNKHTTKIHHVEFMGGAINHMNSGIVAYGRVGASLERTERYIDCYKTRLEDPRPKKSEAMKLDNTAISLDSLLGRRDQFYPILERYKSLLKKKYKNDIESLLRDYLPKLAPGMVSLAVHPLIFTGYALAGNNPDTILEGLALMHSKYEAFNFTITDSVEGFGSGSEDVLDVLKDFAKEDLEPLIQDKANSEKYGLDIYINDFCQRSAILSQETGDLIMSYIKKIGFPENIADIPRGPKKVDAIIKFLIDNALLIYAKSSKPNAFYLLHGVTSSWALSNLLGVVHNHDEAMRILHTYVCTLFVVYYAQGAPQLTCTLDAHDTIDQKFWDDIITEVLEEDRDEHYVKLIQVAYERWKDNPQLGVLYSSTARMVLDNDFVFD